LATFDWNRDGREDFVVSCIDSPTVIATNTSEGAFPWVDVRLHARTTARDAIGARVSVHTGQALVSRELTAGDGYQATNQRVLHFGLPTGSIDRITVRWPSGVISEFRDVRLNVLVDLIEGEPTAIEQTETRSD
jgi:hypothetical protein